MIEGRISIRMPDQDDALHAIIAELGALEIRKGVEVVAIDLMKVVRDD